MKIAAMIINNIHEGDSFSLSEKVTKSLLDRFASLTGDVSPLHMDAAFAKAVGFRGRVAHGVLLLGFFSKLVGVNFPGKYAIIQSINAKFVAPAYIGDTLDCIALVDQISLGVNTMVLKTTIKNQHSLNILVKAKIQVGFTNERTYID
jgi:3-hydroxybutyryl-CoA dehydratase